MRIANLRAALAAVQEHLAGPLGATAQPVFICGPEDSVGFKYRGTTVEVCFDRDIIMEGRGPQWMRVLVGPLKRLYRTPEGYTLAEGGALPRQSSVLYLESEAEVPRILEAALDLIRRAPLELPREAPPLPGPADAPRLVQTLLAGPLGVKAKGERRDSSTVRFTYMGKEAFVQFSPLFGATGVPDWMRVALDWQYLRATPQGYFIVPEREAASEWDITLAVRGPGDVLEVLHGARETLAAGPALVPPPRPEPPVALMDMIEAAFSSRLGSVEGIWFRGHSVMVNLQRGHVGIHLDPAFRAPDASGQWLEIYLHSPEETRVVCADALGMWIGTTDQDPKFRTLAVDGMPGLNQALVRAAGLVAPWAAGHGPGALDNRPRLTVVRPGGEPRLWRVTEEDSNAISLPAVIRRMRQDLGEGFTWEEMIARARELGLLLGLVDHLDPESEDLTEAVWTLGAIWFAHRNPEVNAQLCMDFGMLLVEIGCQDVASLGDLSDRILRAHDLAHTELQKQSALGAGPEGAAIAVLEALEGYFAAGCPAEPRGKDPLAESPLKRVMKSIAEEIRRPKRGWFR